MDVQTKLEKTVLGEILLLDNHGEQLEAVVELSAADFINQTYRKLFNIFNTILAEDKDTVDTLKLYAYEKNLVKEINSLTTDVYSAAYLPQHIRELKSNNYKRKVMGVVKEKQERLQKANSFKDFEIGKDELIASLSGMSLQSDSELMNFSELDKQLLENISKNKDNMIDGYSFGINELDIYTNGLQKSKLLVIGGIKKAGKTRFLIHQIRELYQQNVKTAFLSLEIPSYDLYKLLKSSFIGIEDTKLRAGSQKYLTKDEYERIKSLQFDSDKLIIDCDVGLGISEVIVRLRKYAKLGAQIVFIDFLQRINVDVKNKANELEAMAQLLSNATRELNIGVVLLSQLSNIAEKEIPSIAHLKGSGGIGEAADTIFILDNLYRRTGREENRNLIDLELTQRYGESGKIRIFADLGTCSFKDFSKRRLPGNSENVSGFLKINQKNQKCSLGFSTL